MKKYAHLSLLGAVTRLIPGEGTGEEAATQWERIFGVPRSRDLCAFTNARLGFLRGQDGKPDGIESISVGVVGDRRRREVFRRAEEMGLLDGDGLMKWVKMFGIKWHFVLTGEDEWDSKL